MIIIRAKIKFRKIVIFIRFINLAVLIVNLKKTYFGQRIHQNTRVEAYIKKMGL
ncbi:MAG: hypothetical protein WCD89_07765 [Anaerocolumna sp.]